jgi:hypothetical protein
MTPPNPAFVAAAPIISAVIDEMAAFVSTVLTGDPMQIPLRLDGAAKVFLGNVELQLPALAVAEVSVVKTDILGGLAALKAKVNAAATAT